MGDLFKDKLIRKTREDDLQLAIDVERTLKNREKNIRNYNKAFKEL
ncbi:MAG: hypothetical protein ACOCT9_01980 [archaeon]